MNLVRHNFSTVFETGLSFFDFVVFLVSTLIFLKSDEMCDFFDKRGYPASVVQAGHHRAQQNWLAVSTTDVSEGE